MFLIYALSARGRMGFTPIMARKIITLEIRVNLSSTFIVIF